VQDDAPRQLDPLEVRDESGELVGPEGGEQAVAAGVGRGHGARVRSVTLLPAV
jgi:hypothetical protein